MEETEPSRAFNFGQSPTDRWWTRPEESILLGGTENNGQTFTRLFCHKVCRTTTDWEYAVIRYGNDGEEEGGFLLSYGQMTILEPQA